MLDEWSKRLVDGAVREDDILEENVTSLSGNYDIRTFHRLIVEQISNK